VLINHKNTAVSQRPNVIHRCF